MDGSTRGEGTSEWGRARPPVDDRSLRRRTVSKSSCARKTLRGNGRGGPGCWSDCECSVGMLVCFGGAIAGGKTSVSREVAKALGCGWAGFGAYLRAEVGAEDSQCRKVLQDLGQRRIKRNAAAFCRDVLEHGGFIAGRDFVLDGIRHVEVLQHLAGLAVPSVLRLFVIEADSGLRADRVGERGHRELRDFPRASRHVVEAALEERLPSVADYRVDGSLPLPEVVEECLIEIRRWRSGYCGSQSIVEADTRNGGWQRK